MINGRLTRIYSMRIAIDIRSLTEPLPSGISEYTSQIIKRIIAVGTQHEFVLFCSGQSGTPQSIKDSLDTDNVSFIEKRIPNKLFNSSLYLFNRPKLDSLVGHVDSFFMPALNFAAFTGKCRVTVTVHDISFTYPEFFQKKGSAWHKFIKPKKTLERADTIIAVSESTKRDVVDTYGIPQEKVSVIPSGVEYERFNQVDGSDRDNVAIKYNITSPYILYLGTVESRKNVSSLIDAWEKHIGSDVCNLIIAGRVADSALHKKVPGIQYIGYVSEEDKPALYSGALAFVYPSYFEGFGLPVLEAMASGTPVITSYATSLPDVSQGAALLIDPYNISELVAVIQQVISDKSMRNDLRTKGIAVAQSHSWEITTKKVLEVLTSRE